MQAIETTANFNKNGEIVIDNLPAIKNQKVKLLILVEEDEKNEWNRFSEENLSNAYSIQEPDYDLSMVKESKPDYKQ